MDTLMKTLAHALINGGVAGLLFSIGLFATNVYGLRDLIMAEPNGFGIATVIATMAVSLFGSIAVAAAIMLYR